MTNFNNAISINNAIKDILNEPAPIIMFDTCALLDILRFSQSKFLNCQNIFIAAKLSKNASQDGKGFHLVLAQKVLDEWLVNSEKVEQGTQKALSDIDRQHKALHKIIPYLSKSSGDLYPAEQPILLDSLKIAQKLRELVQTLMTRAVYLLKDDNIELNAYRRIIACRAPSIKGGQAPDCEIIETYLMLMSKLREQQFNEGAYFISSNINDYCDGNKKIPHPDLVSEFTDYKINFCLNLAELNLPE